MLQRVRDLKVQFENGTLAPTTRTRSRPRSPRSRQEVGDIIDQTRSSTARPSSARPAFTFQVGANDSETDHDDRGRLRRHDRHVGRRPRRARRASPAPRGATTALDTGGSSTISTIDTAIKNVSKVRADFGAVQNRLEHRLNNLATYQENLTASESRIRDVDMAAEMTKFTKLNILQQAGTSMLAQANQAPQGVLSLLR